MDEVGRLATQLGGTTIGFRRQGDSLAKQSLSPDNAAYAERLWPYLDGGVSIDQLFEIVSLDNFTIYNVLAELIAAGQAIPVPQEAYAPGKPAPLLMAPHRPLSPWDEVVSLTAHPSTGRAQMRRGSLVGLLRPNDPYHMLHSLNLPYRAAGSPILKNGEVIGMHCGMLPLDPALHALPSHLHQLLWIDAVQTCLTAKQKKSWPHKKSVGMSQTEPKPKDSPKICGKCQATMVKQARFCGTCGSKL